MSHSSILRRRPERSASSASSRPNQTETSVTHWLIESWELACTDPDGLEALVNDDDFIGYGVDAATGCFASPPALATVVKCWLTMTEP